MTMNMKDIEKAMAELEAAKAEIRKLQKVREDAEANMIRAKALLNDSQRYNNESPF
jgi:hypothetical protein